MSARSGQYLPHTGESSADCAHCLAVQSSFTRRGLASAHRFAVANGGGPFLGSGAGGPSPRRFDVLGGPGGYLSARYVGALRPDEYVATWQRIVRVNVPRRMRISPRETYADVLRVFEVA